MIVVLVVEAGGAGGVAGRAGTVVGAGGRGSGAVAVACGAPGTVVVVVVVDVDVDVDIVVVEPGVLAGCDWTTPASVSSGVVVVGMSDRRLDSRGGPETMLTVTSRASRRRSPS